MNTIAVGVFEDHNPVARGVTVVWVVIRFRYPDAISVIKTEADGLHHVGLCRKQGAMEAVGQLHADAGVFWRKWFLRGMEDLFLTIALICS